MDWLKSVLLGDDRMLALMHSPLVGPATREWLRRGRLQQFEPTYSDMGRPGEDPQAFVDRMMMYEELARRDSRVPRETPSMPVLDPYQSLPVWTGGRRKVAG